MPAAAHPAPRVAVAPWLALAAGLALTALAAWALASAADEEARKRFATAELSTTSTILQHLGRHIALLRGSAGTFVGDAVAHAGQGPLDLVADQTTFARFVADLRLPETAPGGLGIGFARKVVAGELAAIVEARRGEGLPEFTVTPPGERAVMYPILYLEPLDQRNRVAIGFDMYSEPLRREAIDRAIATGQPTATAPLRLLQEIDDDVQPGFLICVPVYALDRDAPPERRDVVGLAYSPFRMRDLVVGMFGAAPDPHLALTIRDGDIRLFASPSLPEEPRLRHSQRIDVAGRTWTVDYASTPAFDADAATRLPWWASGIGAALSLLLFRLLRSESAERRRADLALIEIQAGQRRLRRLVESNIVGVFVGDLDGRILEVNDAFLALTGRDRQTTGGLNWRELTAPEQRGLDDAAVAELRRTGRHPPYEKELVRADGTRVPVLVGMALIDPPGPAVVFAVDLAELKAAQARQAESERLFRTMADHAPVMIWIADTANRATWFNQPWLRFTGRAREQELGFGWIESVHPDDRARAGAHRQAHFDRREPFTMEIRMRNAAGEWRWVLDHGVPLHDGAGRFTGYIGSCVDITDRRVAEQRLVRQAEELLRSNAELEQFAFVASHDLQEPLRMVASYTQLLAKRYGAGLDEAGRRYLDFARDGALRMRQLITDLLAWSRASSAEHQPRPCDAAAACRQAIANLTIAIKESGAELVVEELPPVLGDQGQLKQLFQNLLGNALKYRGERAPRVRVSGRRVDGMVEISVADNGIGIAAEHFERIFAVFQRLHGREQYPGTGIGLALCRRIVERHGGRIWVESTPGAGSTFRFTLPAA